MKLELIAFNIQSCKDAQEAGADRVELCDNPDEGGTTPSYGFIKAARDILTIDLYPIIRPRGGDFLYSDEEFDMMKSDIKVCKVFGCNGISTGILKADGSIDKERCKELVELAKPMHVTFHRAFDRVNDFNKALEDIIEIGCERVLTSGGKPNVADAIETIAGLVKQAGNRIIIMPGSGVRSENIGVIAAKTGAKEFHSSARKMIDSKMNFINENMQENLQHAAIDIEEAKKININLKKVIA